MASRHCRLASMILKMVIVTTHKPFKITTKTDVSMKEMKRVKELNRMKTQNKEKERKKKPAKIRT